MTGYNSVKTPGEKFQFSTAAEANKHPILEQLRPILPKGGRLLEIASGTGQHAVFFGSNLPNIIWQPSDRSLDSMDLIPRLQAESSDNVLPPIKLDIAAWPTDLVEYDAVFSANCLHIIPETLLASYIAGAAKSLHSGGLMLLYGPFKYRGEFTTESNARFNTFLGETYDGAGIRDFEAVDEMATLNGLQFVSDTAMPSNNQFLIWRKK